jgi:hypothetical protein
MKSMRQTKTKLHNVQENTRQPLHIVQRLDMRYNIKAEGCGASGLDSSCDTQPHSL